MGGIQSIGMMAYGTRTVAKVQKIVDIFIDVVVVTVLGYLCYQSIGFVRLFIRSGRATRMLKIPYWFIYGIAPVACGSMIYNYFRAKYGKGRKGVGQ